VQFPTVRENNMKRLILLLVLGAVGLGVKSSAPDIARYLKMRQM